MKKLLLAICIGIIPVLAVQAQTTGDKEKGNTTSPVDPKKKKPKPKKQDVIIFNFNWNGMLNSPDSMSVSPFSRGFDFALMWDIPLGRSPLSFAAGLGVSTENIFMNAFLRDSAGGNSLYFQQIKPVINADNPTTERD